MRIKFHVYKSNIYIGGLAQNCGNPIAYAPELPQACAKPSI